MNKLLYNVANNIFLIFIYIYIYIYVCAVVSLIEQRYQKIILFYIELILLTKILDAELIT